MNTIFKIASLLILINTGCASGPSPEEIARQQAEVKIVETEFKVEEAFSQASVSRAALKQFIKSNPNSHYVEQAKAMLNVKLGAVTILKTNQQNYKSDKDSVIHMDVNSLEKTYTIGKSTKQEAQSFLGYGIQQGNMNAASPECYKWNAIQYQRGNRTFGLWGVFGANPLGSLEFCFDASDVLREIHEID